MLRRVHASQEHQEWQRITTTETTAVTETLQPKTSEFHSTTLTAGMRAKKSRARANTSVEPVDCAAEINTEEGKMVVDIAGVHTGIIRASVQTAYY